MRKTRNSFPLTTIGEQLLSIFHRLYSAFGPQNWWPGETPFEVCIGAILTQNTNWNNVEKTILNLKGKGLLSPRALHEIPCERLAAIIRPAGYYNIKAQRIKNFIEFLNNGFQGNLDAFFTIELETARKLLLGIKGIGFETADSILLYAGKKPSFVVDTYTIRALYRHDLVNDDADYESVRTLFMDHLPRDAKLYNEFHALFVRLGKNYCKKTNPICQSCPLAGI